MPLIDTDKLIKEYWEEVKDKYPNFTFEQFEEVCKAPFWYFRRQMESEDTPIMFIKYFGKLRIYSSTIIGLINKNNVRRKKNLLDEEEYIKRDTNLKHKLKEVIEYENTKGNR